MSQGEDRQEREETRSRAKEPRDGNWKRKQGKEEKKLYVWRNRGQNRSKRKKRA